MKLFRVICEYDLGLEFDVFPSKEVALKYAKEAYEFNPGWESWNDLVAESLVQVETLNFIEG